MLRKTSKEGFTLVELSLSMVFISILSLSIVLIISNTLSAYRRGLTLSQLNTVGTELADDMRVAVQNSKVKTLGGSCTLIYSGSKEKVCNDDNAYGLVLVKKTSKITINNKEEIDTPIYGAFCTGSYSYIWNSGYFDSDNAAFEEKSNKEWAILKYRTGEKDESGDDIIEEISSSTGDKDRPFRMLKVEDSSRAVCVAAMNDDYDRNKINNIIDITGEGFDPVKHEPEDILVADEHNNLAIYDLDASRPVESPRGNNAFYSVSFILGTISGGINVMAKGNACTAPTDYESKDFENFDYCAINKFNFAVQVNGGVN